MHGVGFLLSKRAKDALLGYNPVKTHMIVARFSGAPPNIAVLQVYAPTSESSEDDIEAFYRQLERTIENLQERKSKS